MDIQFEESVVSVYRDLARTSRKTHFTMESVVPDTKDDIGRILSVRPVLYFKSKELSGNVAQITGEAAATVFYVNEAEDAVSFVRLSQSFSLEYELPRLDGSAELQLRLSPGSVQARAVNPRKLSVDMEVQGDLTVSARTELVVSQQLPEKVWTPVHLQSGEMESVQIAQVCEKNFTVTDQLAFPDGAPRAGEIMAASLRYRVGETENVGGRLLVKGQALLRLDYLPEDGAVPHGENFTLPFSQLVELSSEDTSDARVQIEPTSAYMELIDAVDGQKLLSVELHALAQVRALRTQTVAFFRDAYSNLMPCACTVAEQTLVTGETSRRENLTAEESVELPEEFSELLTLYATMNANGANGASVSVDLLCRSAEGKLFPMRRSVSLAAPETAANWDDLSYELSGLDWQVNGKTLELRVEAIRSGQERQTACCRRLSALTLDEEKAFDTSAYPAVTAVWAETESVWELAKMYHSSPEAIGALNEDLSRRPVFVPKAE